MQFFVYFTLDKDYKPSGSQPPPSEEEIARMMKFHEEGMKSGTIVATGKLGQNAMVIQGDSVSDGPFIEGKELIPGFTIIEVESKERAVEWVKEYRSMMGMPELRLSEISM